VILLRRPAVYSLCALAVTMMAMPVAAQITDPPAPTEAPASVEKPASSVIVIGTTEKPGEPVKITDKKHPDYVLCRSEAVVGSRASRTRVCRTNREWAAASREGNRQTQEFMNMGRPTQPSP
jgi:hypothetical protein